MKAIALTGLILLGTQTVLALEPMANEPATSPAYEATYKVTITNLTPGQIFSPPVLVVHGATAAVFEPGAKARPGVAAVAEEGTGDVLKAELEKEKGFKQIILGTEAIKPGETKTYMVKSDRTHSRLSIVSMLVTTNDAFVGVHGVQLAGVTSAKLPASAYDAGSEFNSESCKYIPGPPCSAHMAHDMTPAEGFISVHSGIHGIADLSAAQLDWQNPVAKITIHRH